MRREAGTASIEFALGAGLLLLPVAMLVLVLPTLSERQSMARLAAQEAARVMVVGDDWAASAATARAMAARIAENHELPASDLSLALEPGALVRGGEVTAAATVQMPLVIVPGIGPVGGVGWTVRHTEPVDAYRSLP